MTNKNIPTHTDVIDDINEYLDKYKIKPAVFGKIVLGDSGAIVRLRKGTDPRLTTLIKIYKVLDKDVDVTVT